MECFCPMLVKMEGSHWKARDIKAGGGKLSFKCAGVVWIPYLVTLFLYPALVGGGGREDSAPRGSQVHVQDEQRHAEALQGRHCARLAGGALGGK